MEKKNKELIWCTNCCQWVGVEEPHTCYDRIANILADYSRNYLSRDEMYDIIKEISERTETYKDFVGGVEMNKQEFKVGDRVCYNFDKSDLGTIVEINPNQRIGYAIRWDNLPHTTIEHNSRYISLVDDLEYANDVECKPGMTIPCDKGYPVNIETGPDNKGKDTNPKDAIGITKLPFSTLSGPAMGELGLAMMEGALKYGRHNYRAIGIRYSVYFDAAMRHIWLWWEGEDIDPDSGLPHITKAMACLMILRDATIHNQYNDDRPPKTPKEGIDRKVWVDGLNVQAKALRGKYPDPKEPYTEKKEVKND